MAIVKRLEITIINLNFNFEIWKKYKTTQKSSSSYSY